MGLHKPKKSNRLNEALNLAYDIFPAGNFSWNSCEPCLHCFCHVNTLSDCI